MSNTISKGIRNNNPGNLIYTNIAWEGKIPLKYNTDGHFEQFVSMEFGIRAMFKDLINDINKGKNTVRKLISEYAPPNENNTNQYIKDVCASIGVTADQKINSINDKFLILLGKAIIKKENGSDASKVTDLQIKKGLSLIGDVSTDVVKYVKSNNGIAILIPLFLVFYTVFTITL